NNRYEGVLPAGIDWVRVKEEERRSNIYQTDLMDMETPWHHDSTKVAKTIMELYLERTGPLSVKDDATTI
nr:hypothetical protein [Anaerolineaceae bacterium]